MAASESRARDLMTLEQFRAMDESDEYLYELDDGVLVREPRPQRPHGAAVMLLGRHLTGYALELAGAAEVWVVYPGSKSIDLHQPTGESRALGGDEPITSVVLPGFQLPVSEIFRF